MKCVLQKDNNHFALWSHSMPTKNKAGKMEDTTVTLHCSRLSELSPKLILMLL